MQKNDFEDLDRSYELNFHLIQLCRSFAQEKEFWQSMYYELENYKTTSPACRLP